MISSHHVTPHLHEEELQSIPQVFEKVVLKHPGNIAAKSLEKELTYGDLTGKSNRLAHAILHQLGTTPQPIALLFGHNVEQFIGIFGVLKSGHFYVPLDATVPRPRNASIIADTDTQLIVTDDEYIEMAYALAEGQAKVLSVDCGDESDHNLDLSISPLAYAYIMYTSGSTGKPKGVLGRHRDMLHYALTSSVLNQSSQDRTLMLSKYSFSNSLGQTFRTLSHGGGMYAYDVNVQGILSRISTRDVKSGPAVDVIKNILQRFD